MEINKFSCSQETVYPNQSYTRQVRGFHSDVAVRKFHLQKESSPHKCQGNFHLYFRHNGRIHLNRKIHMILPIILQVKYLTLNI